MLKWYGEHVKRQIIMDVESKLKMSGEVIKETAKSSMPINFNTFVEGEDIARSTAGNPPYRQTDKLYKSIETEMLPKRLAVKIGTNVKYGKYLELGTKKMRWRPWLVPALARSIPKIKAIFAKPITGGFLGAKETDFDVNSTIELSEGSSEMISS